MKLGTSTIRRRRMGARGFTLMEMLTGIGLGIIPMAVTVNLFISGSWSFLAMGNYTDLDNKSMRALDVYSMEIRNATRLVASAEGTSLTLTNATSHTQTTLTYDPDARTVVMTKTGQEAVTNLTGCDSWSFKLYNKAPSPSSTNITFSATSNPQDCKLISMTWKCSRSILGSKLNTESVQTAQVVLRNKVN